MDLKRISCAVALGETLHFGRTAAKLNISQSSLSKRISELEEELSTTLFARTRRSVSLTPAGQVFCARARAGIQNLDAAFKAAQETARMSVPIRLGYVGSAAVTLIPELLSRLGEGSRLYYLASGVSAQLSLDVAKGKIDAAIVVAEPRLPGLVFVKIHEEPMVLAISKRCPQSLRARLDPKELESQEFLFFPRENNPVFHDRVVGGLNRCGNFRARSTIDNLDAAALSLVASSEGFTVVPESAKRLRVRGLVYRSLPKEFPAYLYYLVYREDVTLPAVVALQRLLRP